MPYLIIIIRVDKLSHRGHFPLVMADCVWRMNKLTYFWVCFVEKWSFVGSIGGEIWIIGPEELGDIPVGKPKNYME